MDSDTAPTASRGSGSLALLGDQFLGNAVASEWSRQVEIVDLRDHQLGRSGSVEVFARLTQADPTMILLTVCAAQNAAGIIDLTSVERTVNAVEGLMVRLREAFPDAAMIIQSIPPAQSAGSAQSGPAPIKDMNRHIRQFCAAVDATYLDLWQEFAEDDGVMKARCTDDGVTLNPTGREAWIDLVNRSGVFSIADHIASAPSPPGAALAEGP